MIAIRTALEWGGKPPHLFWGLPGEEWTEQDYLLAQAHTLLLTMKCSCGCGGWHDECTNEDLQDEWEPRVGYHYRKAAIEQYREDNKDQLKEPGSFIYLVDSRKAEKE